MQTSSLICHRGASAMAPENTLQAFELARQHGQRWLEMDVAVSADGEAVIFHDEILRRCTNGSGWLIRQSLAELKALDAGSWFSEQFTGATIPALTEVLDWAARHHMFLNLEIKPVLGREPETAAAIHRALEWAFEHTALQADQILFSSFNPLSLQLARECHPGLQRALLTEAIAVDAAARLAALQCEGLHFCAELVDEVAVAELKSLGYQLRCYTVNSAIQAESLFNMGIDAVFSDYPALLSGASETAR
ncbi:glycerophosphodiester phosphodiesterase family protein [Oceanobacter mangrovi]|uniref:glycerophosphodiester phosphodiesterase family protein n=1 Tax=Oceanobacter mangrovi TaxID=2862510 RepID=UPI001C8D6547|nr:glycerophosphodiester phosphodiesterase family protein [Oceanobacter mangrovi]